MQCRKMYNVHGLSFILTSHPVLTLPVYIGYAADSTENQLNHFYIYIYLPLFITIT